MILLGSLCPIFCHWAMPLRGFDDPLVVTLNQRLRLEVLQEVHPRVGKFIVVRFDGGPILPSNDECVTQQALSPAVELETLQIHPGEEESEFLVVLDVRQVHVALDRSGKDDIVVDREPANPGRPPAPGGPARIRSSPWRTREGLDARMIRPSASIQLSTWTPP